MRKGLWQSVGLTLGVLVGWMVIFLGAHVYAGTQEARRLVRVGVPIASAVRVAARTAMVKMLADAGPPYTVNVFDKLGEPQTVDSTQFCSALVVPPPTMAQLLPVLAAAVNAGKQAWPMTTTPTTMYPLRSGVAGAAMLVYGSLSVTVDRATHLTLVSGDAPNCPVNANYAELSTPIAAFVNTPASIPGQSPLTGRSLCLKINPAANQGGIATILQ